MHIHCIHATTYTPNGYTRRRSSTDEAEEKKSIEDEHKQTMDFVRRGSMMNWRITDYDTMVEVCALCCVLCVCAYVFLLHRVSFVPCSLLTIDNPSPTINHLLFYHPSLMVRSPPFALAIKLGSTTRYTTRINSSPISCRRSKGHGL